MCCNELPQSHSSLLKACVQVLIWVRHANRTLCNLLLSILHSQLQTAIGLVPFFLFLQFARLHLEAFKRQMLAGKDGDFCT